MVTILCERDYRVPSGSSILLLLSGLEDVFESLGQTCQVSGKTTKAMIDSGIKVTVDEACLPVKRSMAMCRVFPVNVTECSLPRLVSVEKKGIHMSETNGPS